MSPSPARPWHLPHAPMNVSSPRPSPRARSSSHASYSARGSASTDAVILACWIPQSSAHCPLKTPARCALNQVWLTRARDRVDLAAELGDPPGVDHVPVRRRHVELHVRADRGAHAGRRRSPRSDTRTASRTGSPSTRTSSRPPAAVAGGTSAIPAACRRRRPRSRRRSAPGRPSTRSRAGCCRAPAGRPPFEDAAPAVLEDEPEQRAFDEHEDDPGEDGDVVVGVVDALGVRRRRLGGCETAVAGHRRRHENERERAERAGDERLRAHERVSFYEA